MEKWRASLFWRILAVLCVLGSSVGQPQNDLQFRKRIICDNLNDGSYVYGCSRFYSICTNGNEHPMNCYNNLVLNPVNNQCEEPRSVPVCQRHGENRLFRIKDPFTCTNKPDGNYEADSCSAFYLQCHGGRRFEQQCPPGLVFSPKDNVCDQPAKCKKKSMISPRELDALVANGRHNEKYFGRRNANLAAPNRVHFPRRIAPGRPEDYLVKPGPLVVHDTLLGLNNVKPAHLGRRSSNLAREDISDRPLNYGTSFWTVRTSQQAPASHVIPGFDCAEKSDGYYSKEFCSPTVFVCSAGVTHLQSCPGNLLFDSATSACEYPESCGQPKPAPIQPFPTLAQPQVLPYQQASHFQEVTIYQLHTPALTQVPLQYKASQQLQYQPPALVPQYPMTKVSYQIPQHQSLPTPAPSGAQLFNCLGKIDGYYFEKACTTKVFVCLGGQLSQSECPGQLVFEPQSMSCQHSDQCGKRMALPVQAPPPTPFPVCSENKDEYQVKAPCDSTFYRCTSDGIIELACPSNLVFDPVKSQCVYEETCTQQSKEVPENAPEQAEYAEKVKEQSNQQSVEPKFSCEGRKEGYYILKGCTAHFHSCFGGTASQLACPGSLVFDTSSGTCVNPHVCGKQS